MDIGFYWLREAPRSPGFSGSVPGIFLGTEYFQTMCLENLFEKHCDCILSGVMTGATLGILEFSDFFQSAFSDTRKI